MKISIIGLGYVGLPLACAAAKKTSHEIVGYDVSKSKIEKIRQRICPIEDFQCEEDLQGITLNVSDDSAVLNGSDIYIVCVPTPVLDDYTPDFSFIKESVITIAKYLEKNRIVVIESTVNPGVCDEIVVPMLEEATGMKAGKDFDVAHCPERINPGDAKWNVYNIPRNIGSTGPGATRKAASFYREVVEAEINEMPDLKTTEATKIIENTFRDINIAFVNELARSFDILGIDLVQVIKGASNKPFSFMPHYPGAGVGGHCIPVDPYYLIDRAKKSGFDHKFLKLARQINNSMPKYTVELLVNALNEYEKPLKNTRVGLLGISYKANVADLRESPSLKIRQLLEKKEADLIVYDSFFPEMSNRNNLEEVLNDSFAIIVAADHDEIRKIDTEMLKKCDVKIVIDGKNCLDKESISNNGIYYKGIGH